MSNTIWPDCSNTNWFGLGFPFLIWCNGIGPGFAACGSFYLLGWFVFVLFFFCFIHLLAVYFSVIPILCYSNKKTLRSWFGSIIFITRLFEIMLKSISKKVFILHELLSRIMQRWSGEIFIKKFYILRKH